MTKPFNRILMTGAAGGASFADDCASSAGFAHLFPDSGDYAEADDITVTYQGGGFLRTGPQYKT